MRAPDQLMAIVSVLQIDSASCSSGYCVLVNCISNCLSELVIKLPIVH